MSFLTFFRWSAACIAAVSAGIILAFGFNGIRGLQQDNDELQKDTRNASVERAEIREILENLVRTIHLLQNEYECTDPDGDLQYTCYPNRVGGKP